MQAPLASADMHSNGAVGPDLIGKFVFSGGNLHNY